jgi:hypothetical protein
VIGQPQLQPAGRGGLVEPVPAAACELEVDAEIKGHAAGNHLRQARRELEVEVRVEHQAVFDRAQLCSAHVDLIGPSRRQ